MPVLAPDLGDAFGLYVHWPYCARICPYCDFNVYKDRQIDSRLWSDAFRAEIAYWAQRVEAGPLRSIYFGGGTPSLAPLAVIETVLQAAQAAFGLASNAEITLEINPGDAPLERLQDLSALGINRLSIGVQSFDDECLAFLGRDHSGEQARRVVGEALPLFPKSSLDLIYALPGQRVEDWQAQLAVAFASGIRHLSAYQLTIEPGTAFDHAVRRKRFIPADEEVSAALYEGTQELCADAGLPAYEVSNHAADAAQSVHNQLYWRQASYLGIGPGAHGRVEMAGQRYATLTAAKPAVYLEAVQQRGTGAVSVEELGEEEEFMERLLMGLRLCDGIELPPRFASRVFALNDKISALTAQGLMRREGATLIVTPRGRQLLDSVTDYLLA